jgi:polyisoprenoid-binding protein YceI
MIKNISSYSWVALIQLAMLTAAHASETYTLDPQHSYALWQIKHFDFSTQVGKFYASGTISVDDKKIENSKVNASITTAGISTGNAELDNHLKGKLFFNSDEFPTATFVSNKVTATSEKTANVTGVMTIHGIAKPIMMHVTFNHQGLNPITDKKTVGFSGVTTIRRSDFGISTLLPGLSDDVKLNIEVEAFKSG